MMVGEMDLSFAVAFLLDGDASRAFIVHLTSSGNPVLEKLDVCNH